MSKNMEQINVEFKPNGLEMEMDKQQFALALKTWRLRQGLTQRQLGDKWGVSRFTIIRAETGKTLTWEFAYKLFAKLAGELRKEGQDGI